MKAAAGKVPPEEEERVWGSSEDWSWAALHKVSWYVRTFSPWKRADYWEQGVRMKDLAMWLQPWLSNESSEEWGLASSAWCSWKMAARRETKPCWLGLSERSEVAVSSRKCSFENVGSWLAHLLLPVYKWLPDEIHFSSWKWYSINR